MLGQSSERGVALQHVVIGITDSRQLVEMVHEQHTVKVVGLGRLCLLDQGREDAFGADIGVGEVRDLVAEASHAPTVRGSGGNAKGAPTGG